MPKARIFLSHSTKEEIPARLRDRLAAALTAAGYPVLLDKDVLTLGERWRNTLNLWIGYCDAAVVLLSPAALKSTFVAYEVSVLSYRAAFDPGFLLIPVFLDPVDYAAVEASLLNPSRITERQALNQPITATEAGLDEAVARVVARLDALPERETPLECHAAHLRVLLKDVPLPQARQEIDRLGVPVGPWLPDADVRHKLAFALLGADVETARESIRNLRSYLPESSLVPLKAAVEEMLDLVAAGWVDPRSLREIRGVANLEKLERAVCVNGDSPVTARMYTVAACPRRPADGWPLAPVDGVVGEAAEEDLDDQIRGALVQALRLGGKDEVEEELGYMREDRDPAFVALRCQGLNPEGVRRLRQTFQGVTFFLLTGSRTPADTDLKQAAVELLRPPLEADFEARFEPAYQKARRYVTRRL